MKYLNNKQNTRSLWRINSLSAGVILSLTAISSTQAASNIGDLEIYQAAKGGNITIMMMLDTSGSMDVEEDSPACDLPKGVTSQGVFKEPATTDTPYQRKYCKTGGVIKYFYRKDTKGKWFRCGSLNVGSDNMNVSSCSYGPITAPSITGYLSKQGGNKTGGKKTLYYYKTGTEGRSYDRLTRLKDAIFLLMNNDQLDNEKVSIGIGQYSTQSNSDNVSKSADNISGKILVPASLLTETQRKLIKKEVAALKGTGGTPTANAYAEVGAYMLGNNTPSSNSYSGFNNSIKSSKKDNKYDSPLTSNSTCDGQGIYFLTDGLPNNAPSPLTLMKSALGTKGSIFDLTSSNQLPQGSSSAWNGYGYIYDNGMPEVGAFAKALRSATLNPLGENKKILTAVVGFGSVFEVNKAADAALAEDKRVIRTLSYVDSKGRQRTSEFYNCSNITSLDARNACNWGAKSHPDLPTNVGGFGEGGFYAASSVDDVIDSITTFVNDLDQTLPSAPAGTISIPSDPYRASNQLPYAYLPMLAPDVSSSASIWKGNLKKYNLDQGTLFGDNGKLYKNVAGDLSSTTRDIWQASDFKNSKEAVANNDINAGGFYAQLKTPKSSLNSVRQLYVEDYVDADTKTPILRKLSVDTNGKPVGFNLLQDMDTYTELNKLRLLSFLGFKEAIYDGEKIDFMSDDDVEVSKLTLVKPDEEIRVLGGVVHSTPTAISYNATLNDSGQITNTRDDYVLFGSMDGALHIADAKKGEEKVAIIPKIMLTNQPEALVENSSREDSRTGSPYFGVDAPWLVTTDYKYDLENKKVKIDNEAGKGMFAYGGLRMGGEALYGLDISKVNNLTDSDPKMLFTITKQGVSSATTGKSATSGFGRLGQIWSKPTAAKIRLKKDDVNPTDVLIFGGGYDIAYENDEYVATSLVPARGNAIYMVNAKSGELIWSTSSENTFGKNIKTDTMIHSIVGGITVLDRDNDGLTDHIYAADLGGQVFRIDLQNARTDKFGFIAVPNFLAKKPVRLLDVSPKLSEAKYAYRFYERPVVSFYRRESGPDNGKLFALVNVISGNRSSPLSELRTDNKYANRVYGIIDSDVTRNDLYTTSTFNIEDLSEDKLINLASTLGNAPTEAVKNATKAAMITGKTIGTTTVINKGWYYPLMRFGGNNGEKHIKGMGDSAVINSLLYTTVYNPLKQYGNPDKCSAKIVGGSERQIYCLPYGICSEETSINGTGGFIPAGQGIQELALGAFNKDNTNLKVLIGTTTLEERIKASNRFDFNGGGDGSGSEYIFSERYTFQPKAWYERSQ